ncbi:hypothetical protein ACKKBG_A08915 [Auxenochlorella protothecoides x Auxenochlorella symbiontica]
MSLALGTLNHVSFVVADVAIAAQFYRDVLGFTLVRRPSSFHFDGCWLWRHGLGVHLIRGTPVNKDKSSIVPQSNHLSFLAQDLDTVERQLDDFRIKYVVQRCCEDGVEMRQLFFHDPDNHMIEVCNCDEFPLCLLEGGGDTRHDSSGESDASTFGESVTSMSLCHPPAGQHESGC